MSTAVRAALPAAVLSFFVLAACGCGAHRSTLPVLKVSERDFQITAPRSVSAGEYRVIIHNDGPVAHELLIARAEPGRLPVRDDGFTIKEESIEPRLVGVLEPQLPGHSGVLTVELKPGNYVLFCNMAGHYAAGMQHTLQVR